MIAGPVQTCAHAAVQGVLDRYRPPVVAFDTETTGLRGAVVQAALVELDARGNETACLSGIVRPPPAYRMEPRAEAVHGITEARLCAEAQPARTFFTGFVKRLRAAHESGARVVAHNRDFDVARMNETLRAHGMGEQEINFPVFCTMREAKRHCGLRNRVGGPRYPKNEELYTILTGGDAAQDHGTLHDAAADARVTAHSFLHGQRRGWW
jgi:DNA polymerase III epsilon subunit-like protein